MGGHRVIAPVGLALARPCVPRMTRFIAKPNTATSAIRTAAKRQLTTSVAGKVTNSATKAAQCSRKKVSHSPNIAFGPSSMILVSRPECVSPWKLAGRSHQMSEEIRHRRHAPALREPVGIERDRARRRGS